MTISLWDAYPGNVESSHHLCRFIVWYPLLTSPEDPLLDAACRSTVLCKRTMIKFQDLESFTAGDIEAAIARNASDELPLVPITVALLSPDPGNGTAVCLQLATHEDPKVRGNAILSIGHLARRFRCLDEMLIKPVIEKALRDHDEYVRSSAGSASDEIHQFLHWTIAGHRYG